MLVVGSSLIGKGSEGVSWFACDTRKRMGSARLTLEYSLDDPGDFHDRVILSTTDLGADEYESF